VFASSIRADTLIAFAFLAVVWIPDPELLATMGDSHDLDPSHTHTSMEGFDPAAWGLPPYSS
jgi:pseudouridine 5'-phosphatase